jgi:hypothetical protein
MGNAATSKKGDPAENGKKQNILIINSAFFIHKLQPPPPQFTESSVLAKKHLLLEYFYAFAQGYCVCYIMGYLY